MYGESCDNLNERQMMAELRRAFGIDSALAYDPAASELGDEESYNSGATLCGIVDCSSLAAGVPWGSAADPCAWQGVVCAAQWRNTAKADVTAWWGNPVGDVADSVPGGAIVALYLRGAGLAGFLPDAFYCFPHLAYVDLAWNPGLSGRLAQFNPQWAYFHAGSCRLLGSLPPFPASEHVVFVNLLDNRFTGPVPSFAGLPRLQQLYLGGSVLTGGLPDVSAADFVQGALPFIVITRTVLAGPIPPWYLRATGAAWLSFNRLEGELTLSETLPLFLDVARNRLTGRLPRAPRFTIWLDASQNALSGDLPADFLSLKSLAEPSLLPSFLLLQNNRLSGTLPAAWAEHLGGMRVFLLSSNRLTGTLPDSWGPALSSATSFFIADNPGLTGALPPSWAVGMTALGTLGLWECGLTGSIPEEYGEMPALKRLWLQTNRLDGTMPASFAARSEAAVYELIDVRDNRLTGVFPAVRASELSFGNNRFSGEIEERVFTHPGLVSLTAENNLLSGTVPLSIGSAHSLKRLWLFRNEFTGDIPWAAFHNTSLEDLSLADNKFSGTLPVDMYYVPTLQRLDLNRNRFSGTLPVAKAETHLTTLSLVSNLLSGDFPHLFFMWHTTLLLFKIDDNAISGTLRGVEWVPTLVSVSASLNKLTSWSTSTVDVSLGLDQTNMAAYPSLASIDLSSNELVLSEAEVEALNLPLFFSTLSTINLGGNKNVTGSLLESWNSLSQLSVLNISDTGMADANCTTSMECLPSWLKRSTTKEDRGETHSCYSVEGTGRYVRVSIDDAYFNLTNCLCKEGYYGAQKQCSACLEYAVCPGGERETAIVATAGFFGLPTPDKPQAFVECLDTNPATTPCVPQNGSMSLPCQEGYSGRLCGDCDKEYTSWSRGCVSCPPAWSYGPIVGALVFGVVVYGAFVYRQNPTKTDGTSRVALFYIQMLALANTIGVRGPAVLESSSSGTSLVFFEPPALSCLLSEFQLASVYSFYEEIAFSSTKFIAVLLFVFFVWLFGTLFLLARDKFRHSVPYAYNVYRQDLQKDTSATFQCGETLGPDSQTEQGTESVQIAGGDPAETQSRGEKWFANNVRACVLILITIYPGMCRNVVAALNCTHDPYAAKYYMKTAPTVECYDDAYNTKILLPAVLVLLFIIVGQPLALFCILFNGRQKVLDQNPMFIERWGVLFFKFKRDVFYWEVVCHFRGLIIVALLSLPPEPAY
eukprot:gene6422-9830_t